MNPSGNMRAAQAALFPGSSMRPLSNEIGRTIARKVFEMRGNHSEAHLSEFELAVICAAAAEHAVIMLEGRHG